MNLISRAYINKCLASSMETTAGHRMAVVDFVRGEKAGFTLPFYYKATFE